MSESVSSPGSPYRKVLSMAVAVFAQNAGFHNIDGAVLETLTEMLQSFITETGRSGRAFSELGGRTEPLPADIFVALIEMGIDTQKLQDEMQQLSNSAPCIVLPIPKQQHGQPGSSGVHVGAVRPPPEQAPSFAPGLPDPHTYERTDVTSQPATNHSAIREAAANHKRRMESALVEYMLKTHPTLELFPNESLGQIVVPEPDTRPYLSALLACNNLEASSSDGVNQTQNRERTSENAFMRTATMSSL